LLKIRQEQWDLLSQHMGLTFENNTLVHLRKHWPERCDTLKESGVRSSIQEGITRAKQYGIESEYDILRYINHMYALGFDFDDNEAYPWAKEILTDEHLNAAERMEQLSAKTQVELQS
jgi:hypothetical protein